MVLGYPLTSFLVISCYQISKNNLLFTQHLLLRIKSFILPYTTALCHVTYCFIALFLYSFGTRHSEERVVTEDPHISGPTKLRLLFGRVEQLLVLNTPVNKNGFVINIPCI